MTELSVILWANAGEEATEACIESFLYGKSPVSEILLIGTTPSRYPQVRCVDTVSHALENVRGTWVCFARGQDRVNVDFARALLACAAENPQALPLCGIRSGAAPILCGKPITEPAQVPRELLAPIYNKLFRRDILTAHHLCPVDAGDSTFVRDYLRLGQIRQCVVEDRPLYLRSGESSGQTSLLSRVTGKLVHMKNDRIIAAAAKRLHNKTLPLTILSQNCVGGFLYRDMGQPYRSPTAGLFFRNGDFVRFVLDLDRYLAMEPEMYWGDDHPIGRLGDIEIQFLHYHTCRDAKEKWLRRSSRLIRDKIMVICTDRDGFSDADFELWKTIPYPKVLITCRERYRSHPDTLYLPEFRHQDSVGDLFTARKFYHNHKIIQTINEVIP